MKHIWRVKSQQGRTDYIEAAGVDEAKALFEAKHPGEWANEFQRTEDEMKPWNGQDANRRYQYETDYPMFIDQQGNIFYQNSDGLSLWCSAARLTQHLHWLTVQLPAEK